MVRGLTLTVFLALLLAAPTAGLAKGKSGNSGMGKNPSSGGTTSPKCEQVPPGGKGPLSGSEEQATRSCFSTLVTELGTTLSAGVAGIVSACPNTPPSGLGALGGGVMKLAQAGLTQIDKTKSAKVSYFKAEAAWYSSHPKKNKNGAVAKIDAVVSAIGTSAFDLSGVYSEISSVGSSISNDDCGQAQSNLTHAQSDLTKAQADEHALSGALVALPG